MPSLLKSRGLLAGAGSAASLIAAAFASLIFATGLVAFRSWPGASGSSVPSVNLPAAPTANAVPTGARGRASDVVAAGTVVLPAGGTPANRGTARTIARTGSPFTFAGATAAAPATLPSSGGSQPPAGQPAAPSVTRQVTNGLADTTTNVTHQVGSTVGGPAGSAIEQTGDQVAQTVRDVGAATAPLLGG